MSDDIDRLKNLLEDLRALRDGLGDTAEVASDVIAIVTPVELETDVEGHRELYNFAMDVRGVVREIAAQVANIDVKVADLAIKARL